MTDNPNAAAFMDCQFYTTPFKEAEPIHESIKRIVQDVAWDSPPLLVLHFDNGDAVVAVVEADVEPEFWLRDCTKALEQEYRKNPEGSTDTKVESLSLIHEGWINRGEDGAPVDEGRLVITSDGLNFDKMSVFTRNSGEWRAASDEEIAGISHDLDVIKEAIQEVSA